MRAEDAAVQVATAGLAGAGLAGAGLAGAGRRPLRRVLRDRASVLGLAVVAVFLLGALLAPWLTSYDPVEPDFANRYAAPGPDHLLGTDQVGRDVLSRILHGGRLSLGMALSASLGITLLGTVLGLLAGTYGRAVDTFVMRTVDVLLALPTLILALVVVGLLGQGLRNLVVTIILVQWPRYARLVRGMTLQLREREYVMAARAVGASRLRVMWRHISPNLIGPVAVFSTIDMGQTLLSVSSLSFLGFGVAPPAPEWGAMLSDARHVLDRAPHLLLFPGLAITLLVLAFNLAGDGLRDLLDPRSGGDAGPAADGPRPRSALVSRRRRRGRGVRPGLGWWRRAWRARRRRRP